MKLSYAVLPTLPEKIARPHRLAPPPIGIMHFGAGAFHRAHQASYIDSLLDDDPRWGISAVSLRSGGSVSALADQQGLYTIAMRDAASSMRVIGAHGEFLGPHDTVGIARRLADPALRLVTSTVTEKGYCLSSDGTLEFGHPDIMADLSGGRPPVSIIGWLASGLAARHAAGVAPFTVLPCDNLASNGMKIKAAVVAFVRRNDPGLADWIVNTVHVPGSMVDSITPASDAALYADVTATLGVDDGAAVQREAFVQWVIEDQGVALGPDLRAVGAILTPDVAGFERAKLRMLNGAHSALAYAGLLRGHASVAEAMRDPWLAAFVDAMIRIDIVPMLPQLAGLDLNIYREQILARFRNPSIVHALAQIAQDGTQKLPYRLADTVDASRRAARMPIHVVAALGCWVAFIIDRARSATTIVDPASAKLRAIVDFRSPTDVVSRLIDADLGLSGRWATDSVLIAALSDAAEVASSRQWHALLTPD